MQRLRQHYQVIDAVEFRPPTSGVVGAADVRLAWRPLDRLTLLVLVSV